TPLVHCLLQAPMSRMDVITEAETQKLVRGSQLVSKYNQEMDRESAYELLQRKVLSAHDNNREELPSRPTGRTKAEPSTFETVMKSPVTNTIIREVTRGLLGVLGITTTRRRR
ncbi:MAG: DUF853 family protein, partial [Bacteroidales bacterium]|nr:DUF853 family protein [Bacteroidales bacterium]